MRLDRAASIDDLRRLARRRLPRLAFDFMDGGAQSEANLARNADAFARLLLRPRALVDVSRRDQGVELFGRRRDGALGIAPVGLANLIWPGADLAMARAAAKTGVPVVLSTAATTPLETAAEAAQGHAWFQLYVSADRTVRDDLIRRARAAGCEALVVTVDVPVAGKRDRDIRNGFRLPFRLDAATLADFARRPAWAAAMLRHGLPRFETLAPYAPPGAGAQSLAAFMAAQISAAFDRAELRQVRDQWPGKLVVKGILTAEDALACLEDGADGVIVSNHGGRQLDAGPAAIEALPAVVAAVGERLVVMLDSGIRRGADIVRAFALGARYTFSARCVLYGAAAGGEAGILRALALLRQETDQILGQLGRPRLAEVDGSCLWR